MVCFVGVMRALQLNTHTHQPLTNICIDGALAFGGLLVGHVYCVRTCWTMTILLATKTPRSQTRGNVRTRSARLEIRLRRCVVCLWMCVCVSAGVSRLRVC